MSSYLIPLMLPVWGETKIVRLEELVPQLFVAVRVAVNVPGLLYVYSGF
jgi:hypothetical protein